MGHIKNFNISSLINKYNTKFFVETGTGFGDSLSYAFNFDFDHFYSIEIETIIYESVTHKIRKSNCTILNETSEDGLVKILSNIKEGNVLFWLDAHFPGADFGLTSYDSTEEYNIRLPLESELRKICSIRDTSNDVFLIDDLRVYEDGPFTKGSWPLRESIGGKNIDFIYELFGNTHIITKDYNDEGYIMLTPKKE